MAHRTPHPARRQNTTAAFESLRRNIETNTTVYREQFAERMRRTVADAETTTGREMAVGNITVDVTRMQLPQQFS